MKHALNGRVWRRIGKATNHSYLHPHSEPLEAGSRPQPRSSGPIGRSVVVVTDEDKTVRSLLSSPLSLGVAEANRPRSQSADEPTLPQTAKPTENRT